MNRSNLYPEPPHISASFYLDHMSPRDAFAAVCDQVVAVGAAPAGVLQIVRAPAFPRFSMISDLASQIELVALNMRNEHESEQWMLWLHGREVLLHVLSAVFSVPKTGIAVVEFGPIPEGSSEEVPHPVAVVMSGSLLSMPAQVSLNNWEREQRVAVAQFLMAVFRSACESLEPLYGSIAVEASLPSPTELIAGQARVGTELFVSARLESIDPTLEVDLTAIFDGGFSEKWMTGEFFSGWAPFNAVGHTVNVPMAVSSAAAYRLGQALRSKT